MKILAAVWLVVLTIGTGSALAAGGKGGHTAAPANAKDSGAPKSKKVKVFDFGAIGIEGTMRTPQLLYFLGRAREELERANLEKRSFMPELVRSVDEGSL
jgi:hypothetical protein